MKIDVLMGGPGREAVISRRSGTAIADALRRRGHDVAVIDITERLDAKTLRGDAVAFNIVHGTYGEDGTLQAELDALGVSYVGSDAAISRLCMDKGQTKARLTEHRLRVPWGVRLDLRQPFSPKDLKIPHHAGLVLKPACDGSSVGLKMIANPSFILPAIEEILRELGPVPYLLEERLPGPEYTVAVVDLGDGPRALPPLAIRAADGVFDFDAKYQRADTMEMPVTDAAIAARLAELGLAAHNACGCRDISRCDIMRTNDGDYALLEVNTLPGFTTASLVPKAAAAAGIIFDELVERLAGRAASRASVHTSAHTSAREGNTP
jgi:D-alanine-D-alanine ligase